MKVTGAGASGTAGGPRQPRPAGGEGFRLPSLAPASAAGQAGQVSSAAGVMGVDALLALQDMGGPLERRRRAVRRAGHILDVLDAVKLALLEGALSPGDLQRLRRAVHDERAGTDDARLEALLDEIELRAAVEMAKLETAHAA